MKTMIMCFVVDEELLYTEYDSAPDGNLDVLESMVEQGYPAVIAKSLEELTTLLGHEIENQIRRI